MVAPANSLVEGWVAIVDDDESIRRSLVRVFRINGIAARTFASAEEFLSHNSAEEPACLVVDINLGGMSGFALEERLVSSGRPLPIIFMTAMDDIALAQLETRSGPHRYLRKPFDTNALLALVRQHCASAEAAQQ